MALRMIELILPETETDKIEELLEGHVVLGRWREPLNDNLALVKLLVSAEESEVVMDSFEKRFAAADGFRMLLFSVEAALPRPEEPEPAPVEAAEAAAEPEGEKRPIRISRAEMYADIDDISRLTRIYVTMVVLSSLVATVGILRDNVAVIIGAMVIAPLLGPNVGLALATTLGDVTLAGRALKAGIVGITIAFVLSVTLGLVLPVDPTISEIASRTHVGLGDVALALAAGAAGTLAFTTGVPSALVGVMVAVALLPPLVTFGLLLGSGNGRLAVGALLVALTNIVCVNLAGVVTFLVQGVRPLTWWEASKAKKATRLAIALWVVLLLALVALIVLSRGPLG